MKSKLMILLVCLLPLFSYAEDKLVLIAVKTDISASKLQQAKTYFANHGVGVKGRVYVHTPTGNEWYVACARQSQFTDNMPQSDIDTLRALIDDAAKAQFDIVTDAAAELVARGMRSKKQIGE